MTRPQRALTPLKFEVIFNYDILFKMAQSYPHVPKLAQLTVPKYVFHPKYSAKYHLPHHQQCLNTPLLLLIKLWRSKCRGEWGTFAHGAHCLGRKFDHISDVREEVGWPTARQLYEQHSLNFLHKIRCTGEPELFSTSG